MRSRVLVAALGAGILVGSVAGGCWVDRKTSEFACTTDADCDRLSGPPRTCDEDLGYCVRGNDDNNNDDCPDACTNCNMQQRTCTITCLNAAACDGDIRCPAGWECTINCANNGCDDIFCDDDAECHINCTGNSACGNIDCDRGLCDVSCTGQNACDNIECGEGRCDVTCTGPGACDTVNCADSCRCDVTCSGDDGCESASCPLSECAQNGGCSSSANGCPATCS